MQSQINQSRLFQGSMLEKGRNIVIIKGKNKDKKLAVADSPWKGKFPVFMFSGYVSKAKNAST